MSDSKSPLGEPVEDPAKVDDVVGSVEDSLADAEAAGRDAVGDSAGTPAEVAPAEVAPAEVAESAPAAAEAPADELTPDMDADAWSKAAGWTDADAAAPAAAAAAAEPVAAPEPETVVADTAPEAATTAYAAYEAPADTYVVPSEAAGAAVPLAAQPIFVQAPDAPTPKGNRAAAGAIGLLAALSFAVLYLVSWLIVGAVEGDVTTGNVGSAALAALATWSLWVPVVVFFIAFWLLGAIINRGRWGAWVIFGLLVGFAAWGGHILGQLFQSQFWMLTVNEGVALVQEQLWAPLAIAALVLGRELTIWFGAWAAARGRRVAELNLEAQREYERTIEAGPQLIRQ